METLEELLARISSEMATSAILEDVISDFKKQMLEIGIECDVKYELDIKKVDVKKIIDMKRNETKKENEKEESEYIIKASQEMMDYFEKMSGRK